MHMHIYAVCVLLSHDIIVSFLILYTQHAVPSKISNVNATATIDSNGKPAMHLSWDTPCSDTPVFKYQIRFLAANSSWKVRNRTNTSGSTVLGRLAKGTHYQIRMTAISFIGIGPLSDIVNITTFDGN